MGILDRFSLSGKIALVTGGSGRYGKDVTRGMAEAGATTITASPFPEEEEALAAKLRDGGLDVHPAEFDLGDAKSIDALHEDLNRRFGRLDVLVNCAVFEPMERFDAPLAKLRDSIRINATGVFQITRLFIEDMKQRRQGSVVNIASIYGVVGPDFTLYEGTDRDVSPAYFFNKGGLIQLTRYFAARFGPYNVRVNAVSPGCRFNDQEEPFYGRYCARTFLGRMACEDDLCGVIVFLASDAASYITGANIAVDAGHTAK